MCPQTAPLLAVPAPAAADPAPGWVRSLVGDVTPDHSEHHNSILQRWTLPTASVLRLCVPGARQLTARLFESVVARAYDTLREQLGREHPHVVRCWHYLPGIREPMDERRDRYMVFNAGRFATMGRWLDHDPQWRSRLPAASAVGHDGDELRIDLLAIGSPGVSIENPRQTPAVDYSSAYGPRPPCFARACRIDATLLGRPALLISGTASIRGEATVHPGQLAPQLHETWLNLDHLLGGAAAGALTELRVYHPNLEDRPEIQAFLTQHVNAAATVEMVTAELCRSDLRVEIEAVAAGEM